MKKAVMLAVGIVMAGLMQGCATSTTRSAVVPAVATVKLGTFANVELEPVVIAAPYAASWPNQTAAKTINELLINQMADVFPGMNSVEKKSGSTLIIKPVIKEITFINKKARIIGGAMPGSSSVLMDVTYLEKDTGKVVAQAEFYDHASAFAGNISVGKSDVKMLDNVVKQVINFSTANR